jgi:hypothetical protein
VSADEKPAGRRDDAPAERNAAGRDHSPAAAAPHGRLPDASLLIVAGQVLLMLLVPLLDDGGKGVPATLFTAAMAVSAFTVLALGNRSASQAFAVVCAVVLAGAFFSSHERPLARLAITAALVGTYCTAAFLTVRQAFTGNLSATQRILCGAACYPMVGIVFTIIHAFVGFVDHGAYAFTAGDAAARGPHWIDYYWMSFSLLTTAGFSELSPAGKWGYLVAMLEAVAGVLFPATLIARIAALPPR